MIRGKIARPALFCLILCPTLVALSAVLAVMTIRRPDATIEFTGSKLMWMAIIIAALIPVFQNWHNRKTRELPQ